MVDGLWRTGSAPDRNASLRAVMVHIRRRFSFWPRGAELGRCDGSDRSIWCRFGADGSRMPFRFPVTRRLQRLFRPSDAEAEHCRGAFEQDGADLHADVAFRQCPDRGRRAAVWRCRR
ncbi:hypothetical protein D3C87_1505880 [compost metagenome]